MSLACFRLRFVGLALFLVLCSPLAVFAQSSDARSLHSGKILVAASDYDDPVFGRSVILITHYGPDGAAGIMLNRQTPTPVSKMLPGLDLHSTLYMGGPVAKDGLLALLQSTTKPPGATSVFGDLFVIWDESMLEKTLIQPRGQFHAYLGYCEWSPRQ